MDISSLTPNKQVKLQYWLDVIRQCRASGLTNQAWCAYSARTAHPFQRNGAPFRFKLSKAQQVD